MSCCSFVNNFVNGTCNYGGAIYNKDDYFTVSCCSFVNNFVNGKYGYGGVIYNGASDVTVSNCSFVNDYAGKEGGAIYNKGKYFTVGNCSFVNNSVSEYGGAICNEGKYFTVGNCSFVNNSASRGGGAIDLNSGAFGFILSNCIFVNNSASRDGGAIDNFGSGSMTNCSFVNNSASRDGGAIYTGVSIVTIINSKFKNNNASNGTVIYNYRSLDYNGTINLNNNTYSGISNGKTHIYNEGIILTPVTITVLGNKTLNSEYDENVTLFATIVTSDGASVAGGTLNFIIDESSIQATSNTNGNYNHVYAVPFENTCIVVGA